MKLSAGSPSIRPAQRFTTTSLSSPKRPASNSVITPKLRPLRSVSSIRQRLVGPARALQGGAIRASSLRSPPLAHCWQAAVSRASSWGRIRLSKGLSSPARAGAAQAVLSSRLPSSGAARRWLPSLAVLLSTVPLR